jgi:hypothetical protein
MCSSDTCWNSALSDRVVRGKRCVAVTLAGIAR